jgi:hypothetical protein
LQTFIQPNRNAMFDEFIIDSRRHERLDVRPRTLSRLYFGCDKDPCNGAGVSSFEVLGEAAAVSQPREGFFDDPAARTSKSLAMSERLMIFRRSEEPPEMRRLRMPWMPR